MKVLCVDDSVLIRKIVSQAVEVLDLTVVEAQDGKEALDIVEKLSGEIGLITLDWHMPRVDGFEFLNIIKSQEKTRDIPVLMLTSESPNDSIVKAIKAGVNHYLLKPFTQEDLIVKIKECIGKAV